MLLYSMFNIIILSTILFQIRLNFQIVQVDRETVKDGIVGRIRRHPSKPLPEFNDARRLVLQERTVYVTGFPREGVTLDDLIDFFENNFEQVGGTRQHIGILANYNFSSENCTIVRS
jgi:hypothetical protein